MKIPSSYQKQKKIIIKAQVTNDMFYKDLVFTVNGSPVQAIKKNPAEYTISNITEGEYTIKAMVSGTYGSEKDSAEISFYAKSKTTDVQTDVIMAFTVYPNPFTNSLVIKTENSSDEKIRIEIYNFEMRRVYLDEVYGNEIELNDMSIFSQGIYLIKITSGNQIYSQKVVKN
ncbi:MAG: T9SS type A sorting domain-containing protein [Bacteroidales bacterium]|nr:T9SS type A sorting domain-containing protein [Bacteroidales bacterium]